MKILAAIDFSELGDQAVRAAAAIAAQRRSELVLLHVRTGRDRAPADLQGTLARLAAELARVHGIATESVIGDGSAAEMIVDLATKATAELIVVGARGHRVQEGWLLGSVAEQVAQTATIPTLAVRDAAPLVAWASGSQPLAILIGVERNHSSYSALEWARREAARGGCQLHVAWIVWPATEHERLGVTGPQPLDHLRPEVEATLRRELATWAGAPAPGETHHVRPGWGCVDAHLDLVARELGCKLVVVGTHQRAGLARLWQASVSRGVLAASHTNVVCIPRTL